MVIESSFASRPSGGEFGVTSGEGGVMAFHPYLFFGGNCRAAFTAYEEIFGGKLVLITMKEMPSEQPVPAGQDDLIAHAALMTDDQLLMGSDDPTTDKFGPVQGMMVNYSVPEVADAERAFTA